MKDRPSREGVIILEPRTTPVLAPASSERLLKRVDGCIESLAALHQDFAAIRAKIEKGMERKNLRKELGPEIYNIVTRAQNLVTSSNSLSNEVHNIERGIYAHEDTKARVENFLETLNDTPSREERAEISGKFIERELKAKQGEGQC
jgi:hypothetical protein